MDSMRSLNTSLPHPRPQPPEQLLSAFKTAALSITNLYKTAVTDQSTSRQTGYQDALDDLLSFLDKENLGVQDGDGWRIRQWATERFERTSYGQQSSESEDERGDTEKRARSSSPALERKTTQENPVLRDETPESSPMRTESAPPQTNTQTEPEPTDRTSPFRFAAAPSPDMQMQSTESLIQSQGHQDEPTSETAPIRVEVFNRASRTSQRNSSNRHNTRASNREFTFTSGNKRKFQFPDFFDISNVGGGRDRDRDRDSFGGGGKRGRFV